ncbi:MAG: hypothetical protein JSS78_03665 [Bacteroidetes bacterium]|nr:hypothetical protein [Bacteroidota bacterium]
MKLMFSLFCLFMPTFLFSQHLEFGLGGGVSMNGTPTDNMYMKAERHTVNYATSLSLHYDLNAYLQIGADLQISQLSGKSNNIYYTYWGVKVGGDDRTLVYAKTMIAPCFVVNGKYSIGKGYLFGGVALGYGVARQNSKSLSGNESYRAPDGGKGEIFGLQLGYVAPINNHFAVSAEAAFRQYHLQYDTHTSSIGEKENLNYRINAFPIIIALRYRIFSQDKETKTQAKFH